MKNLIWVLLALSPLFSKAQYNEWISGKALTDSSHNNRNACLYGQYGTTVLFWDQELDSTTTQLCFRNIDGSGIGEEHILRTEAGVKLTNPQILDINFFSQPPNYLVLFQTNEGNDIDLKAMKYQADGTFSQPVTVSEIPGDDVNLTISYNGIVAWQNNGKIWVSQYLSSTNSFTTPFAIDSAGSYDPLFGASSFYYLKPNGDSTTIKTLNLSYNQGNWEISNLFSISFRGEGSCLTTASAPFGSYVLCLQNKIGLNPSGLILFDDRINQMEYINSPNYNFTQPTVSNFIMYTKSVGSPFLAFVSDSLSQKEIFVGSPFNELQNISQWPGEDRNPKMFLTIYSSIGSVKLFWESDREGFSTIYYSHLDYFLGGIPEKPKTETILVKPCPFSKEATISLQSPGIIQLRILDIQGREVKSIISHKADNIWQEAIWDGTNNRGNVVPSGSYLVVATSGNTTQSRIIIKE